MAKQLPYEPGAILHEAIVGAFKARGGSFERWCVENGINSANARNCTFGQSRGAAGRALLQRLIEAAGPDYVQMAYLERLERTLKDVRANARRVS